LFVEVGTFFTKKKRKQKKQWEALHMLHAIMPFSVISFSCDTSIKKQKNRFIPQIIAKIGKIKPI
jgi:hypothetical protein